MLYSQPKFWPVSQENNAGCRNMLSQWRDMFCSAHGRGNGSESAFTPREPASTQMSHPQSRDSAQALREMRESAQGLREIAQRSRGGASLIGSALSVGDDSQGSLPNYRHLSPTINAQVAHLLKVLSPWPMWNHGWISTLDVQFAGCTLWAVWSVNQPTILHFSWIQRHTQPHIIIMTGVFFYARQLCCVTLPGSIGVFACFAGFWIWSTVSKHSFSTLLGISDFTIMPNQQTCVCPPYWLPNPKHATLPSVLKSSE